MRSYTAHLQPGREPVLLAEGWSWGAFLFGPLWLLARRAWLPALGLVLALLLVAVAAPPAWGPILGFGLSLLAGLLGRDCVRWSLERRGFTMEHVVAARDEEAALGRLLTFRPEVAADFESTLR